MKINLNIELDLPDKYKILDDEFIRQLIFDEFINYSVVSHFSDALFWLTQKENKWNGEEYNKNAQKIVEKHNEFARIIQNAKWNLKVLD